MEHKKKNVFPVPNLQSSGLKKGCLAERALKCFAQAAAMLPKWKTGIFQTQNILLSKGKMKMSGNLVSPPPNSAIFRISWLLSSVLG